MSLSYSYTYLQEEIEMNKIKWTGTDGIGGMLPATAAIISIFVLYPLGMFVLWLNDFEPILSTRLQVLGILGYVALAHLLALPFTIYLLRSKG